MYRNMALSIALVMVLLGVAMIVRTLAQGGFGVGVAARRALHRGRRRPLLDAAGEGPIARKLPGLRRELDARALFSVAYGEIASSIYFALGVLAAHALGFTPIVLLAVGALFLIVSLSYAEGTAALPETGGAATFVRRALERSGRLHDRLGALPRLRDRDRALGALPSALPGGCAAGRRARPQPVGRDRRRRDDRARRGDPALPAAVALRARHRHPGARPADAAAARGARLHLRLLAARADARHVARLAPDVACARVLAAARDARLHRARDGREPGRGGTPARRRPAALGIRRHRHGRDDVRGDRDRRAVRLPWARRRSSARAGSARRSSASRPRSRPSSRSGSAIRCVSMSG